MIPTIKYLNPTMIMIEYENLAQMNRPFFEEFKRTFGDVLEKGWYILGQQVAAFEKEFCRYLCVSTSHFGVGVASGLDALTLSFKCVDYPAGGEVIVAANSYVASIFSILNADLKPVLVDPDPETYNLSVKGVEAALTPRTVAILPVHMYGKPCPMPELMQLASQHGLLVVEDCAQAHGASIHGQKVGTFGSFGAFSFYPTKNLGALGDGGVVVVGDEGSAEKLRALRNYGSREKYYNDYIGMNSRLDEVQAAFLRIKLGHLEQINSHKRHLAAIYTENLRGVILPKKIEGTEEVYHIYPIRHFRRDALRHYLLEKGVKTEVHYPVPPHRQKALVPLFGAASLPISEEIHATILSLPISFIHTERDVLRVVELINEFCNR